MPYWPDMSGLGTSMIPISRFTDHPDLTMDGKRSRFALCASFSATLIISAYIPGLEDRDIAFLTNGGGWRVVRILRCSKRRWVEMRRLMSTTSLANENRSPIEIMITSMPSQATTIYRVSLLWRFSFVIPTGMLSTQRRRIVWLLQVTIQSSFFEACDGHNSQGWQASGAVVKK